VEHIVYVPCQRESEMIGNRGDHIDNVEGSLTFGGEFGHLIGEIKVRGFKPDLVARLVFWHGGFLIVCDDVYRGPGPGTVLFHVLKACFCCLIIGGDLLIGGEWQLIAQ